MTIEEAGQHALPRGVDDLIAIQTQADLDDAIPVHHDIGLSR